MGFLRRLFGGAKQETDPGLYYYIRLHNLPNKPSTDDEVVEVRITPNNDLSQDDDGKWFVRKTVVGKRKFKRGELVLHFDTRRQLQDYEITGGELVNAEDYEAYLASLK